MRATLLLANHCFKARFKANRMKVLWPLLILFILGSAWGLSDINANILGGIEVDSAYTVLYISSAFILLSATLGAVFISFDGISRDRISGVLEIKLSQPISRKSLGSSLILGHWAAIALPTCLLSLIAIVIIGERMDEYPSIGEIGLYIGATMLVLLWYTLIQLIASSWADDMGSSIALGMGSWMLFTLLWLLLTTVVAGLLGVAVDQNESAEWLQIQALMDLLSPNGLYHLLLEIPLSEFNRGIDTVLVIFSAILWTVLPTWLLMKRLQYLTP